MTGQDGPEAAPVIAATAEDAAAVARVEARLAGLGVGFRTWHHRPVFTVEEARATWDMIPALHCKNLFLRDAKGQQWLVSLPAEASADIKTLPHVIGSKRLSFGSAERLWAALRVIPGAVTPFAVMNDPDRAVTVVLDQRLLEFDQVCFHPLTNAATTALTPEGLLTFLRAEHHEPQVVPVPAAA